MPNTDPASQSPDSTTPSQEAPQSDQNKELDRSQAASGTGADKSSGGENLFHDYNDTDGAPDASSGPTRSNYSENDFSQAAVNWVAAEFIHHHKSGSWYALLGLAAVIIAALVYVITHDFISTGVVVFGALLFGVYGARKPRQVPYTLTLKIIKIDQKQYFLEGYRSFSVVPEGDANSIILMPMKRFSVPVTILYPSDVEAKILDILSAILPQADYQHDVIDQLLHRIRF